MHQLAETTFTGQTYIFDEDTHTHTHTQGLSDT